MSTTTKLPDHSDVDAARSKRIADEVADEAICLAFEGVDLILRATTPDTPEPVMTAWIGLFHGLPSNVREIRRLGSHYVSSVIESVVLGSSTRLDPVGKQAVSQLRPGY